MLCYYIVVSGIFTVLHFCILFTEGQNCKICTPLPPTCFNIAYTYFDSILKISSTLNYSSNFKVQTCLFLSFFLKRWVVIIIFFDFPIVFQEQFSEWKMACSKFFFFFLMLCNTLQSLELGQALVLRKLTQIYKTCLDLMTVKFFQLDR